MFSNCQGDQLVPLLLRGGQYPGEIINIKCFIFSSGANVNKPRDGDGWSPLFVAAMLGRLETANLLLQAGADTTVRDNLHRTADVVARHFGHHSVADIILRWETSDL